MMASHGRDFEHISLPFIRLLAPEAFGTPALGDFDRVGVDQIAWNDRDEIELVVQTKGFKVGERELGESQVTQCTKSIKAFINGGRRARTYLLVHNRQGKDEYFRNKINKQLSSLVTSKLVDRAELWSCDKLMVEVANAVREKVVKYIRSPNIEGGGEASMEGLTNVPLREYNCIIDRHRLKETGIHRTQTVDPANILLSLGSGVDARAVLLGEAGFGKTTAAMRVARSAHIRVFFLRAAALAGHPQNRNTLLDEFSFVEQLLDDIPPEDFPIIEPLVRAAMESVFSTTDMPALLVIDGLDESFALSRRGGLQWLFNSIKTYEIPVILTSRTEFWRARAIDFATSLGHESPRPGAKQRDTNLKIVELLPWDDSQILLLATRFRDGLTNTVNKSNVQEFVELVEKQNYVQIYGDIPRRPLFLQMILDTVAQVGVHVTKRTELLEEWARLKIIRDFRDPLKFGSGRLSILESRESIDITLDIAFRAMMRAAALMTNVSNGELEMLPSCSVEGVLNAESSLSNIADPLGLFLNSLLVPVTKIGMSTIIRFGHYVYQEFFLARFIESHRDEFNGIKIPHDVEQWISKAPRRDT